MKNVKSFAAGVFFYLLSLASILYYLSLGPVLHPLHRIVILSVFCLAAYCGSRLLRIARPAQSTKIMKSTFFVFFLVYLHLLLNFTLADISFGRLHTFGTIFSDPYPLSFYLENTVNLIPFKTIALFMRSYKEHSIHLSAIAVNLLGNFIALMPMALFLPMFFKKCRKLLPFSAVTGAVVILIELLQLLFAVGSCDIDDLILNVSGAVAAFLIVRSKPGKSFLKKVTCLKYEM